MTQHFRDAEAGRGLALDAAIAAELLLPGGDAAKREPQLRADGWVADRASVNAPGEVAPSIGTDMQTTETGQSADLHLLREEIAALEAFKARLGGHIWDKPRDTSVGPFARHYLAVGSNAPPLSR